MATLPAVPASDARCAGINVQVISDKNVFPFAVKPRIHPVVTINRYRLTREQAAAHIEAALVLVMHLHQLYHAQVESCLRQYPRIAHAS